MKKGKNEQPAPAPEMSKNSIKLNNQIGDSDCTYLVICVTEKGASKPKWAAFERTSPFAQGPATFSRLTMTFYSAADACDALHTYLKGKKL